MTCSRTTCFPAPLQRGVGEAEGQFQVVTLICVGAIPLCEQVATLLT